MQQQYLQSASPEIEVKFSELTYLGTKDHVIPN